MSELEMLDLTDLEGAPVEGAPPAEEANDPMRRANMRPRHEPLTPQALELASLPAREIEQGLTDAQEKVEDAYGVLKNRRIQFEMLTNRARFRTDEAWKASSAEHLAPLLTAEDHVLKTAEEVFAYAKAAEEATGTNREPTLSDADMTRANARREFVREDCEDLSQAELSQKILHAMQDQDAALLWLYHRYGVRRFNASRHSDLNDQAGRVHLQTLLDNLTKRLTDQRPSKVNVKAKELRKAALDIRKDAESRRMQQSVEEAARLNRSF